MNDYLTFILPVAQTTGKRRIFLSPATLIKGVSSLNSDLENSKVLDRQQHLPKPT